MGNSTSSRGNLSQEENLHVDQLSGVQVESGSGSGTTGARSAARVGYSAYAKQLYGS